MVLHDAEIFTVKEINRLKILQDVIDHNLRPAQAAEMLCITPQHCSRLLNRYRQSGPLGMNNQSRGRSGNRRLPTLLTDQALSHPGTLFRFWSKSGARKLAENHGIVLDKETLRRLMIKTGLWVLRKQRRQEFSNHALAGPVVVNRYRLMVVTTTGSRTVYPTLLLWSMLTMRLIQLHFVKSESTFTYFEATRGYLEKYV